MRRRKRKKRYKRKPIPSAVKKYVRKRDDNRCVYCGKKERKKKGLLKKPMKLQFGHFIAVAKGGNNCYENIQLECPTCNLMKGTDVWNVNWFTKLFRGVSGCSGKCEHKEVPE